MPGEFFINFTVPSANLLVCCPGYAQTGYLLTVRLGEMCLYSTFKPTHGLNAVKIYNFGKKDSQQRKILSVKNYYLL